MLLVWKTQPHAFLRSDKMARILGRGEAALSTIRSIVSEAEVTASVYGEQWRWTSHRPGRSSLQWKLQTQLSWKIGIDSAGKRVYSLCQRQLHRSSQKGYMGPAFFLDFIQISSRSEVQDAWKLYIALVIQRQMVSQKQLGHIYG